MNNSILDISIFSRKRINSLYKILEIFSKKINNLPCSIIVSLNDYNRNDTLILKKTFKDVYFFNTSNYSHDQNLDNVISKGKSKYFWIVSDDDNYEKINLNLIIDRLLNDQPDYLFLNYDIIENSKVRSSRFQSKFNKNNLLKFSYSYSFCSSNILKRKTWEKHNRNKFYNTNFWHLDVITQIIANVINKCISINEPQLQMIAKPFQDKRNEHGEKFYEKANFTAIRISQDPKIGIISRYYLLNISLISFRWTLHKTKCHQTRLFLKKKLFREINIFGKIIYHLLFIRKILWILTGILSVK